MTPLDTAWSRPFRRKLRAWFRRFARDLPWRREPTLYRVWISEIMLQQTQVVTVIPFFERFVARFPNVQQLAAADESEVLRHWEGLGYYRRAKQLHRAAKEVVRRHDGALPTTFDEWLALPGVGRYTAGAVLSIALNQAQPIVEANTARLFSRLMLLRDDLTTASSQASLWQFADDVLPRKSPGEFNQALMELGALVCTPKEPKCQSCPALSLCPTFAANLQHEIPAPKVKTIYEKLTHAAVVIRHDDRVLVRQCDDNSRWAGLWDFPRVEVKEPDSETALLPWLTSAVEAQTGVAPQIHERFTTIQHSVTRYRITLWCYHAGVDDAHYQKSIQTPAQRWVTIDELASLPLNVTARKIAEMLTA